jgi:hypothetical protein
LDANWTVIEIMIYKTNYKSLIIYAELLTALYKAQQETVLKFHRVLAVSALLYGSERWTLTKQQFQ